MYSQESETGEAVETEFTPGRESVVQAVVETVAAARDSDPLELATLADSVDPDALEALFDRDATPSVARSLTFRYEGLDVTVTGDGAVVARPPTP
jgi:hypothetical protein